MRSRRPTPAPPSDQRGQALILAALLIIIGFGALLFRTTTLVSSSLADQQTKNTERALAQVKEELIGWSASRTPVPASLTIRPGELPCPDMNNNGLDDDGACAAGAIGRVPWKTLGVPDPKDSAGETLWYAIAGPFRYKNVNPQPITSDTLGNLVVYQGSSATILTSLAIAVLFAPGPPLGAQTRGSAPALCPTTGTTIPGQNCAANYLETTGGGNNAQTGGPFIGAGASGTFNDRVLAIVNPDLMPLVEQRVAREMMSLLRQYKDARGVYPWADRYDGDSNGDVGPFPDAYNRARFPCGVAQPFTWASTGIPLPDWLANTNGCPDTTLWPAQVDGWSSLIYYAVAKSKLQNSGNECTTCSVNLLLTVTNTGFAYLCTIAPVPFSCTWGSVPSGSAEVILIAPGGSDGSPRNWPTTNFSPITGYFEDAENGDNNDDNYRIPSPSNLNRDRMFIMR